jgi:hypothetical protein
MPVRILIILTLLAVPVLAQKQNAVQKTSPVAAEINQTVEAMQGTWLGKMAANVPGFAPETFDWSMNCQIVAKGAGLLCANRGRASIGSMEESCLLAFDPEGKAVHYMCVTSMGEVHDHKGRWVDAHTIEFEPLRAGMMGRPITERLRWRFADLNAFRIYRATAVESRNRITLNRV